MSWRIFDRAAGRYEAWYATRRGRLADAAERGLLLHLFGVFPHACSAIEIGSGTGHFAAFLAQRRLKVIGLDRAPAMLVEARSRFPLLPLILADAHDLPFPDRSSDLAVFVTTLEFLEEPVQALREAVRVARQGVIALVLNRHSLGGLSRRWGSQSRGTLLARAHDYSVYELREQIGRASYPRAQTIQTVTTLFADGFSACISRVPLGDVIGCAVTLRAASPDYPGSRKDRFQ